MKILLGIAAAICLSTQALGQRVFVDGQQVNFDVRPITRDGFMYVPARSVFDKMGITIDWIRERDLIVATKGTDKIEMVLNSRQARVNGQMVTTEVAAFIHQGRTMIPLRFLAVATGADVSYVNGVVRITTPREGKKPSR
jgi:hypothetical protein